MDIASLQRDYYAASTAVGLPLVDRTLHERNIVSVCTKRSVARLEKLVKTLQDQTRHMNAVLHAVNLREFALAELKRACAVMDGIAPTTIADHHLKGAAQLRDVSLVRNHKMRCRMSSPKERREEDQEGTQGRRYGTSKAVSVGAAKQVCKQPVPCCFSPNGRGTPNRAGTLQIKFYGLLSTQDEMRRNSIRSPFNIWAAV